MNFKRLVFPAAFAGAILINPAVQAQTPTAAQEGQALIDGWKSDMARIIETDHGASRRAALSARTAKLSDDLQKLKCFNNDRGFFENHIDRMAKELSVIVARKLDCGADNKFVDSSISLSDVSATLLTDDVALNAATASNGLILNYLSSWGHDAQMALAIKDSTARNQKLADIENIATGNIEKLTCHPKVKFDFKQAAMDEKDRRALPVTQLFATGECQSGKWKVVLHLGPILNNPAETNRTNWTMVSRDIFSTNSFTSDSQKISYADKFKPGGDYINKLNSIACSDADHTVDTVRSEFKRKAEGLKRQFSFSEPMMTCTNGHLVTAVHVESLKSDSKGKK
jgi:hypothetical protein